MALYATFSNMISRVKHKQKNTRGHLGGSRNILETCFAQASHFYVKQAFFSLYLPVIATLVYNSLSI